LPKHKDKKEWQEIVLDAKLWWCSPKYATLDKTEIDVKESDIESHQMMKQLL
jgi:hypothetical protein